MVWQRNGFQKSYIWLIHYLANFDRFIWCCFPAHHCLKVKCAKKTGDFFTMPCISRVTKSREVLGLFIYFCLWRGYLDIDESISLNAIPPDKTKHRALFIFDNTERSCSIRDIIAPRMTISHPEGDDISSAYLRSLQIWIFFFSHLDERYVHRSSNLNWISSKLSMIPTDVSNKGLNGFEGDTIWRDQLLLWMDM